MTEPRRILIADDEAAVRQLLRTVLEGEGFVVSEATSGGEVLAQLGNGHVKPDLVLLDWRMPEPDGMQVLQRISDQGIDVPVVLMTAFGTSNNAIKAMQLGARDYIIKPFEVDDVLEAVHRYFDYRAQRAETKELQRERRLDPAERIVGRSPKMLEIYKTIGRVAQSEATVLITGETGTGKELVAEVIHFNSLRRHGPLVKVAIASLPETLVESELFGHEKGSFTSAYAQRKGRFELAHKGTIFLDEIGEMSLGTQKKLLRVIQEREFERVGGTSPIQVDTRIVAATNKVLEDEVAAGHFRADLYYRLNVIRINMPPLRERIEDLPMLVEHFLQKHRLNASAPPARISVEALETLMRHDWPGNVRELENTIERAVVLAQGDVITSAHLVLSRDLSQRVVDLREKVRQRVPLPEVLADVEKNLLLEAIKQTNGNRDDAASLLGLAPDELLGRLRAYHLDD